MNKIVLEHYPTDKLPDDIKAELKGVKSVKLTIEDEPATRLTREDILAFRNKQAIRGDDPVAAIRSLRDEWD